MRATRHFSRIVTRLDWRRRPLRKKAKLLRPVRAEIAGHRHDPKRGVAVVSEAWQSARPGLERLDPSLAEALDGYYRLARTAQQVMAENRRLLGEGRYVQQFMRTRRELIVTLDRLFRDAEDPSPMRRSDPLAEAARRLHQRRARAGESQTSPEIQGRRRLVR